MLHTPKLKIYKINRIRRIVIMTRMTQDRYEKPYFAMGPYIKTLQGLKELYRENTYT